MIPNPDKPVTMRDVARSLGIAQSTVSRALRNDVRISKDLRKKIAAKARELNYKPNPYVSAFTSQVRNHRRSPVRPSIAMLDCFPAGSDRKYLRYYVEGAKARAASFGFSTEPIALRDLDGSISALNRILKARGIRGLLVLPVPDNTDLREIEFDRLSAATLDPTLRRPDLHRATPDYFHAMGVALKTLVERGYRRISFCTLKSELRLFGQRWLGSFYQWRARNGMCVEPYIDTHWRKADFLAYLRDQKPDVVLSNSMSYYNWLLIEGISVPEEIAFASLSAPARPTKVGGVYQNWVEVGAAGIDLIISYIFRNEFGLAKYPKSVSIRSYWVEGDSIAPPKASPKKKKIKKTRQAAAAARS